MNSSNTSLQNNNNNNSINNNNDSVCNNNNTCSPNKNLTNGSTVDSMTTGVTFSNEQPDPDYIKMFVGQVPKSMDEEQLREMFEEFGRVHSINVLRDKGTGVSKGELLSDYNHVPNNFLLFIQLRNSLRDSFQAQSLLTNNLILFQKEKAYPPTFGENGS